MPMSHGHPLPQLANLYLLLRVTTSIALYSRIAISEVVKSARALL